MLKLESEERSAVIHRLEVEEIIWFTSINERGIAHPNPVWFYWDGELILVYSQPSSHRVRNIKRHPEVALNLQGVDGSGNNVVIINGLAELKPGNQAIPAGYWVKYDRFLSELGMSKDGIVRDYSVEIRVKPLKVRTG